MKKITNTTIFVTIAGIAQLVERNLAKVDVAGSSPVSRSSFLYVTICVPCNVFIAYCSLLITNW